MIKSKGPTTALVRKGNLSSCKPASGAIPVEASFSQQQKQLAKA